jgi:carboxypeptidase Q
MTKTLTTAVLSATLLATVFAQPAPERIDLNAIAAIRDEGMHRSQVSSVFAMLTDVIGPRLTGSPAYKRAADWTRDRLAAWGMSNSHLEAWEFGRGWELDKLTIEMVEPRYMPLIGYAEAWSPSTAGEIVAPAVYLAGKSADEIAAMPLKGAAVLQSPIVTDFIATDRVAPAMQPDVPPAAASASGGRQGRQAGAGGRQGGAAAANQAIRNGGAAVLIRPSRGMHGTVFVQAGRDNPDDRLPKIVLAGEHYNLIARLIQRAVPVKLRVNVQGRFLDQDRNSYNVLAELPGSDPVLADQVVMLGAHLDSWHTAAGADGVAAVMEAFRIIKAAGLRPKRTLRLALWGGEEEGLLGSRAYVRAHLEGDAHAPERRRISVYFNIDPGKGPIYGWYLENNDDVRPIFDTWLLPFKDIGAIRNVRQGIGNTDHLSFIAAGVPGFNALQDYVDYDVREHHTNADTPERVSVDDLQQDAVVLAAFIYHAASREAMIPSSVRK